MHSENGSCYTEQRARQSQSQAILPPAGEVHLETIIKDLRERFARVELQVSPPLVAFRESVFHQAELPEAISKPPKVCTAYPTCIASPAGQTPGMLTAARGSPCDLQSESTTTHSMQLADTACTGSAGTCSILHEQALRLLHPLLCFAAGGGGNHS